MTDQPPNYPPPPPGGGYGYSPPPDGYGSPPPGGYGYPPPGGYGYPPPPAGYGYGYPAQQSFGTNGMAIASLVSALAGLLCMIGSVLGVIFGIIALNQIKSTGQPGRGMALAGLIIGGITTAFAVVLFFIVIIVGNNTEHERTYDSSAPAVVTSVAHQAISSAMVPARLPGSVN